MRKFNISVNGASYEVEVEEIGGGYSAPAPVAAPVSAPAVAAAPAPAAAPAAPKAAAPVGAGEQIKSPMPGNIWGIVATPGQMVKEGDTILILEAMKMENEILAPKDGKVVSINVEKGATVEAGQLLFVIA